MSLTKTTVLAAAAIAALMMTDGAFAKTFEAVYTVSIHSQATKKSSVIDKLFEGERVKIDNCDDDWCLISHDGPDGWVPLASLETVGSGYSDDGPTIVIEGGFNFGHHPKKPGGGVIVDPVHPPKHFGPIVGTFPVSVSNPGFGPKPVLPPKHPFQPVGGGLGGLNGGGNGGSNICTIKPIACQGGLGPFHHP